MGKGQGRGRGRKRRGRHGRRAARRWRMRSRRRRQGSWGCSAPGARLRPRSKRPGQGEGQGQDPRIRIRMAFRRGRTALGRTAYRCVGFDAPRPTHVPCPYLGPAQAACCLLRRWLSAVPRPRHRPQACGAVAHATGHRLAAAARCPLPVDGSTAASPLGLSWAPVDPACVLGSRSHYPQHSQPRLSRLRLRLHSTVTFTAPSHAPLALLAADPGPTPRRPCVRLTHVPLAPPCTSRFPLAPPCATHVPLARPAYRAPAPSPSATSRLPLHIARTSLGCA